MLFAIHAILEAELSTGIPLKISKFGSQLTMVKIFTINTSITKNMPLFTKALLELRFIVT